MTTKAPQARLRRKEYLDNAEEVAQYAGVDRSTLYRIMHRKRTGSAATRARIEECGIKLPPLSAYPKGV